MRIHQKNKDNYEKGFVLVLALMLITLMSVLAITSFELVISTTRITNNHKKYLQALYVADAGVEHTLCVLSKVSWIGDGWIEEGGLSYQELYEKFGNLNLGAGWNYDSGTKQWQTTNNDLDNPYTVTMTMIVEEVEESKFRVDKFRVESTGTVSSFTKTIVAEIGNIPDPKILLWMEKEM